MYNIPFTMQHPCIACNTGDTVTRGTSYYPRVIFLNYGIYYIVSDMPARLAVHLVHTICIGCKVENVFRWKSLHGILCMNTLNILRLTYKHYLH